jgi:peptide/nickel transport system substrate-binding protein
LRTKRILLAIPAFLALALALTLFFVSARAQPALNQLVVSSSGDASFLNPVLAQDSSSSEVNGFVFNGLLKYDRDLKKLVGDLAESWEVKEGGRPQITFHLRQGVRWHDGAPFTADDVKFTFERIMDPKTNTVRRSDFELVDRLEVLDPHTVRVTYKEPFSPGLETWSMGMIPKHLLEGKDLNTAAFNSNPVGTGPFRFVRWVPDEGIELAANDDYWEGRPHLDRLLIRIIPETSLSEIELLTGGIDLYGLEPHQYARISRDERLRVFRQPALGYTYIGWNLKNPLFQDVRVRRALACAIDRGQIVRHVLYGLGQVSTGPFPYHMWYANPNVKALPYDPKLAAELLRQAGWVRGPDGILTKGGQRFSFRLMTNSGNDVRSDISVMVQRQLAELGIDIKLEVYEWSVFLKNFITPRLFDAVVLGWGLGVDPDCYSIFHSSQIKDGFNVTGYSNPEADRLMIEGRRAYDRKKRREIYWRLHQLIADDQPYCFLFVPDGTAALRNRFAVLETEGGKQHVVPVTTSKAGLTYDIIKWVTRVGPEMTAR